MYSEKTLLHMIATRKSALQAKLKPLNKIKTELSEVKSNLQLEKQREIEILTSFERENAKLSEIAAKAAKNRKISVSELKSETEVYKNKQKLLLFLQNYAKSRFSRSKAVHLSGQISLLEESLQRIQDEAHSRDSIHRFEVQIKAEERRFNDIRSSTSIASILDMEPYWRYLRENRDRLEGLAREGEVWVEKLKKRRGECVEELRGVGEEQEERGAAVQVMNMIGTKFTEKSKELEMNERRLLELERLLVAATNIVSLIAAAVMGTSESLDVKPSNAPSYLDHCSSYLQSLP